MTRTSVLFWSAASGFVVGLLAGVSALALVTLIVNLVPGVPARLVDRLRLPVIGLLLLGLPLAGAILGYLEGRGKV